ncbi:ATP-dependent helicase HrpB [Jatrophihabitans sp. YIM 134969]
MLPGAGSAGADLPVRAVLPDVVTAVRERGTAVLVAPPGSGKTSLLPLALADAVDGRVLVAEPRRLATRAAAHRLATLVGEKLGGRVGFAMRGERVGGSDVRVEVVTTGLLVQRLQRDPELPGVGAVVLDECHERHLDSDLALAFGVDVRTNLRDDLAFVATSATADTASMTRVLGTDGSPAPAVTSDAASHGVDIVWAPPDRPLPLLPGARVDPRMLAHVADVVQQALSETTGDVLVFLPGEREIETVARSVRGDVDVLPLFGRQRAEAQDRALRVGPRRRVVLSTAVAESSLTVPGVRVVVDAGYSREPRVDHARGLGALVTTRVSKASAEQRAGRAGREALGVVYRCWSRHDDVYLAAHPTPEIAAADLTGFALAVAAWGAPGGSGLRWLDAPPGPALDAATGLLTQLGALDDDGRITRRGRAMADVGAHPRLARAVLDGADLVGADRAREVVAILSDESLAGRGDDLPARWRQLRHGDDPATGRWRAEIRRLGRGGPSARGSVPDDLAAGIVVGLAFPDRLARARSADATSYLMSGGTGVSLTPDSPLRGSGWLAVAVADRPVGRADARVRAAAPIDEATAREVGAALLHRATDIAWDDDGLRVVERESLGAIVLSERRPARPDPAAVRAAVRDGVRRSGLGVLRFTPAAQEFRARLALCHTVLGDPWPDVSDAALLARLDDWLGPDLDGVRRTSDLARIDVVAALRRLLPWPQAGRLDDLVPERVPIPTGEQRRLDYTAGDAPVLALRVQEAFGWTDTPTVLDGRVRVVLHLLSPAGRPAAVTSDLASFWRQGYPQVRADLRGRYPRHPWPDDPLAATPTRRAAPRRR